MAAVMLTDRDALLAIYHSAGGANWRRKDNWDTGAYLSRWYGVKVNNEGRVVELGLSSNNLQGPIPNELGALSELGTLSLYNNKLTGHIPPELGDLSALIVLSLSENKLDGPIPKEFGALSKLTRIRLSFNQLNGPIPKELGALFKLETLRLEDNALTGPIPPALGNLRELQTLWLSTNRLTGPIPSELGNLAALRSLNLWNNQLSGTIPPELGKLEALKALSISYNQLSGHIPPELGALSKLQTLRLYHNKLTGGPSRGESLDAWRARLRQQQAAEHGRKEEALGRRSSPTRGEQPGETNAPPAGRPSSSEGGNAEDAFRVQVASFAELDGLTRENHKALEEVKHLLEKSAAGSFPPGTGLPDADKLLELDRLVCSAKALGEVASRHMEDKEMQRKELAFRPGCRVYYVAVRTGLCNAYLAASVVGSNLVQTSKTGGLGMAGEVLKLLSGVAPVVGGLASFAAAALKAGDRNIQTRRVVKIADMAADAVECCSLARRLAFRLTDGMAAGTISTSGKAAGFRCPTTAGVGGGAGGCDWSASIGASGGASEEAFLEWFVEEVANCEPGNGARKMTPEEQAGKKLGKQHLYTLLGAIGRNCLRGAITIEEKVERLLQVVAPGAATGSVAPLDTLEKPLGWAPVSAPPHDGSLNREAEFAAMKAKLEALELGDERRQAKLEALELADERRQAKLDAVEAENKKLMSKVGTIEKRIPKSSGDPSDLVDTGGGQIHLQRRKAKTQEERWDEMAESAAAAADHHPVTHEQLRDFAAVQDEKHREHDANYSQLQGAMDTNTKNKKRSTFAGFFARRR